MKKSSVDLTQGNIAKMIFTFALPILAGQIFQNLYNSVDAIVVGNYVGTTALAAVSSSSDITFLLTGFFTGLSTGAGVLFSRHFGAKEYDKLHDTIHTAILFSVLLGLCMATVGVLIAPLLLNIVGCPADVFPEAKGYLRIYLIGVLFTAMYNVGSGVLRAVGDSRSPFMYLVIASITNIVLDIVFVVWFSMGVTGVALATIISQGISVSLVFRRMMKTQDVYRLNMRELKIDKKILVQVLDLGLPAGLQASLLSISNMFIQRYINAFGASAMAGIGAAKKIDKFAGMIGQCLGQATTTFVSQNLGAGKEDRAFRGIRTCLIMAFVSVMCIGIPVYYNAELFVRLFTQDAGSIGFGVAMVHTMMPLFYIQSLNHVFAYATRGFGKSRVVMLCSMCGMIGMRQLYLAIATHFSDNIRVIYLGYPVGWGFAALFVMIYFFKKIYLPRRKMRAAA